ncbi:NodB homology domain-containing protein OS=Streptomyces gougerotii OX=53448 GN=GCM10010227_06100 PE=4 SV=1 [Streptomyces diastaticus subsp. diastaticus]
MPTTDPETTTPSWQWPETTWRRHVDAVRAGRPLRPERWPDGARVAVALSFDSDHETIPLRDGQTSPGLLAQGEYGARVGAPRVLALLARFGVPATFFMPAVSALLHPEEARAYTRDGHEIAVHGWIHERNTLLAAEDEKELVGRALETLTEITGERPTGIRTPSWDFSDSTLDTILDLGFAYDSSLMADDEPYEILAGGLAYPGSWRSRSTGSATTRRTSPWTATAPSARTAAPGTCWRSGGTSSTPPTAPAASSSSTWHPHVIGHRSRLTVLRELLDHICAHPGVWYATHADLARAVRTAPPAHEIPEHTS